MRELGYEQEEAVCTAAIIAAIKVDRYGDVLGTCDESGGKLSTSTRLYSFALAQARAANKQALVVSILNHIKNSPTAARKPSTAGKMATIAAKNSSLAKTRSDDTETVPEILSEFNHCLHSGEQGIVGQERRDAQVCTGQGGELAPQDLQGGLWCRLTREGVPSPAACYTATLSAVHLKKEKRVFEIFNEVKTHTVKDDMYEIILGAACQMKQHKLVLEILDYMQASGVDSTAGYQNTRRPVFKLGGRHRLVLDMIDFMNRAGVKTLAPVYVSATRTAFKSKQYDLVFDILQKMKEIEVSAGGGGGVPSRSDVIQRSDQLLRAFKAMRECGYESNELLVQTALRAAIKLERHDDVISICNDLSGKASASTRLNSRALEQAYASNNQPLVDSILDNIKKSTTAA
ncbi:hypothetical protein ON010_g10279 [Phytophthora cinnamomi]|nr:hypothetical protein ON010_g10279 [Phytophthora cinnamomi]